PTKLLKSLTESRDALLHLGIILGEANQHADAPQPLRLLATRNKRPRCCPSQKRDELTSSHCLPLAQADHPSGSKLHWERPRQCPLWVKSRHMRRNKSCPLYSQLRPQKRIFALRHVRFTPKSGHVQCTSACPLWANSGHEGRSKLRHKVVSPCNGKQRYSHEWEG